MPYAKVINNQYVEDIPEDVNTNWDADHYCTAWNLTESERALFNIVPMLHIDKPGFIPAGQIAERVGAEFKNGEWLMKWALRDMTADEQVEQDKYVATKIDALWRAADTYVSGYISGVAIGLLTVGLIQQKPKALSITQWSSAVWASYYERKALVSADSVDDLDFSVAGPMPHSVPELQAELGM